MPFIVIQGFLKSIKNYKIRKEGNMLDVFVDALLDTIKLTPFLFLVYIFIELIEEHTFGKLKSNRFLKGKFAPLFGTTIGILPQCGFSVVASDLYAKRHIHLGTLLSVFIATSDEAIPIMMSSPHGWEKLWPVILIKVGLALFVGYAVDVLMYGFRPTTKVVESTSNDDEAEHVGCCGHIIEENHDNQFKKFFVHPMLHTLKILTYILIINLLLGTIIHYIGEEKLTNFMSITGIFQPAIAGLVGLIPNCASSVLITQLYLMDSLSLGSCIAGLSVNAGLGLAYLFKANKNIKENILITLGLYIFSTVVGILIALI